MDSIVLTRGKHLRDNISRSGEVWVHKTSLIPPPFIEVPVPSQESKRSCICMLEVSILPLFLRFLNCFDNGISLCFFFFPVIFHIPSNSSHIFFISVSTICDWILELFQQCCIVFKYFYCELYDIFFTM
jgi:hypothetical protein